MKPRRWRLVAAFVFLASILAVAANAQPGRVQVFITDKDSIGIGGGSPQVDADTTASIPILGATQVIVFYGSADTTGGAIFGTGPGQATDSLSTSGWQFSNNGTVWTTLSATAGIGSGSTNIAGVAVQGVMPATNARISFGQATNIGGRVIIFYPATTPGSLSDLIPAGIPIRYMRLILKPITRFRCATCTTNTVIPGVAIKVLVYRGNELPASTGTKSRFATW